MITLEELTTPITVEEWKASIYDVMARLGVETTTWKPGAVTRAIITAIATMLAAISRLSALIARSGFLDLASGVWLTLLAHHQYGVDRQEATFATGEATITNSAGGVYDFDPDDLILVHSTTKKTYRNVHHVHIGSGGQATISIRAIEAGSPSSANPGTITEFETPYLGLSVTNASALVGLDVESDPALRTRCREKLYTLGVGGSREAYSYWAKTATRADRSRIGVTRAQVSDGSIVGHVTVTVATASGGVDTSDLADIDNALRTHVLPYGATLTTQSAVAHPISVTCEVWVKLNSDNDIPNAQTVISDAMRAYVDSVPIGGYQLNPGELDGYCPQVGLIAAITSCGLDVVHVTMASPAANVQLAPLQVAVLSLPLAITVHRVPMEEAESA